MRRAQLRGNILDMGSKVNAIAGFGRIQRGCLLAGASQARTLRFATAFRRKRARSNKKTRTANGNMQGRAGEAFFMMRRP
jgi:hypothetical protein